MNKILILADDNTIIDIVESYTFIKAHNGEYVNSSEVDAIGILIEDKNTVYPLSLNRVEIENEIPDEVAPFKYCYGVSEGFYKNVNWKEPLDIEKVIIDINNKLNPSINYNTCTIDEIKDWQIDKSKEKLDSYLNNNPIESNCHGGIMKRYSITKEKQALLTQMILVTQLALQKGNNYQPYWNATGETSTYDWTLDELQQLELEIDSFVRPMVNHQQMTEDQIRSAETKEEVLAISIEFN